MSMWSSEVLTEVISPEGPFETAKSEKLLEQNPGLTIKLCFPATACEIGVSGGERTTRTIVGEQTSTARLALTTTVLLAASANPESIAVAATPVVVATDAFTIGVLALWSCAEDDAGQLDTRAEERFVQMG